MMENPEDKQRLTFDHVHSTTLFYCRVFCPEMFSPKIQTQLCNQRLTHPLPLTTSVINPDFFPCPFPYVFVVITTVQQRRALSAKA